MKTGIHADLTGIVLIGGASKRMGSPKALLELDGEKLFFRAAQKLAGKLDRVYLSGKVEQEGPTRSGGFPLIPDRYQDIGPLAGILSAFEYLPEDTALLILATDMPLVDDASIDVLIRHRNPARYATIFRNEKNGFLEPLFAIYEARARSRFKQAVIDGQLAIHKILLPGEIQVVDGLDERILTNINFPFEWKKLH